MPVLKDPEELIMKTLILTLMIALMTTACAPPMSADPAGLNESSSTVADENSEQDILQRKTIKTSSDMNLRTLMVGILEYEVVLPLGSEISIDTATQPVNYQFRNASGNLEFSSTGFYPHVRILKSSLNSAEISRLNQLSTGLYISATISGGLITGPTYPAVKAGTAGDGFTAYFNSNGKPKKSFSASVLKRFPNINKGVSLSSLPGAAQTKWTRLMQELQKVGDRTKATEKSLLIIDRVAAVQHAKDFAKTGVVQKLGAWSIAVEGTATMNGFANVPCAEFMSEILRQAYQRAGYSHFEDFNSSKGNVLSYEGGSALVTNFSAYLAKAGWIAWDPQVYIPPAGAFLMHANGVSPGHTYMSAGDSGRFIVDNGMPQGRDLRTTSQNTIEMMYQHGVFFLPPGFNPKKW